MASSVIGGPKPLHEEREDYIRSKLTEWLPRGAVYMTDTAVNWTEEVIEVREHRLYEMIGCESFEDYCAGYLNVPPEFIEAVQRGRELLLRDGHTEPTISAAVQAARAAPLGEHGNRPGEENSRNRGDNVTSVPDRGNAQTYTLRRLARDRPDLLDRVETGDLSPHAAAIEAGFRHRTWTAPQDLERLADALLRRYSQPELDELAKRIA